MSKRKAFILEPTKLDVEGAKLFGDIEYVFSESDRRSSIWSDSFLTEIVTTLIRKGFDADKDYFVVVGHMVPIALAVAVLCKHYRSVNLLLYSSTTRDYAAKTISD